MRLKLGVARSEDVSYSLNYKNNNSNLYSKNENLTCLLQTKLTEPSQETGDAMGLAPVGPGSQGFLVGTGHPAAGRLHEGRPPPRGCSARFRVPKAQTKAPCCPTVSQGRGALPLPALEESLHQVHQGREAVTALFFFFFNIYFMLEYS